MSRFIKKDENGFYVFDEREFLKTLPTGLEYFAVDKESKQIYGLGFNYKQKMDKQIADLEAKLVESEKKASKKNDESWDLYLSLKQFYSRLGVEAYADDEIQDVAVKELNRLLNENEQLKQQHEDKGE